MCLPSFVRCTLYCLLSTATSEPNATLNLTWLYPVDRLLQRWLSWSHCELHRLQPGCDGGVDVIKVFGCDRSGIIYCLYGRAHVAAALNVQVFSKNLLRVMGSIPGRPRNIFFNYRKLYLGFVGYTVGICVLTSTYKLRNSHWQRKFSMLITAKVLIKQSWEASFVPVRSLCQ